MLLQCLLSALCLVHCVLARALLPPTQAPLVSPQQQDHAKPEHRGVMIAYKRSGENHEVTFQFPLGRPLRGFVLHNDPWHDTRKAVQSMQIVAVLDMETTIAGSLEELGQVRCRLEPEFSAEEARAATASGVELGVWPTFGFEDGIISFDRSESRWFLAGRSIKSIECW